MQNIVVVVEWGGSWGMWNCEWWKLSDGICDEPLRMCWASVEMNGCMDGRLDGWVDHLQSPKSFHVNHFHNNAPTMQHLVFVGWLGAWGWDLGTGGAL